MLKNDGTSSKGRLPHWLKADADRASASDSLSVRSTLQANRLHTVCHNASCPNKTECWNSGTAAFLILGNICTRSCRFCGVSKGTPRGLERDEPDRVARAVAFLKLKYAVITSVTRDDLTDGGAFLFAEAIKAIRKERPGCRIEVLIPDFSGSKRALETVLEAAPDVLNHNIETVPSLYPSARPQADYRRSLELLASAHDYGARTKTGLMLGLGEGPNEVTAVMQDIRMANCSILTLGQYLQPGLQQLPVEKYYHPSEFVAFQKQALAMGFLHVEAGPLVRSSYRAEQYGAG